MHLKRGHPPQSSCISDLSGDKSSGGEGLCLCGQVIPLWFPGACEFHSPSCSFPPSLWELCAPDNQENITNCTGRPWSAPDIRKAVCRKCPAQRLCWKQLYSHNYQWPGLVFSKDIFAIPNTYSVLSLEDRDRLS